MADQTNPPAKPDPAEKPAEKMGDQKDKDSFALPKSQQLSTTQQIFIWALVLFVGVLFGAGPIADTLLGNSDRVEMHAGVSENDILGRQSVARRLQDLLNPEKNPAGEYFDPAAYDRNFDMKSYWAYRVKMTRRADALGLLPDGASLEALVKEFLNKTLPDNAAKRFVDALQEVEGTDTGVTLQELRRHVAEDRALRLVSAARIVAPAVPIASGDLVPPMNQMDYFRGLRGDEVAIDEVVLNATHLLSVVQDDDAEIQLVFERLKGSRFTSLTAVEATVAYVDVPALAAKTAVADSDIEANYNAHKDDLYRKAPPAPEEKKPEEKKPEEKTGDAPAEDTKPAEVKAPEPPKIEYQPLAEVAAEIKTKLARERAELQAKELVMQFNTAADALLSDTDNVRFKAKAAELGLQAREKVFIEEPRAGGTLDAGEFGMLSEAQLHLFNQEHGTITSAVQSTGDKAAWLVLRIDGRREAGFRELSDPAVKAEVKAVLAGERAYKDLLTKAEEIRAAAEKLGPGGLKKWAESDAAKPWAAKVTNKKEAIFDISPFEQRQGGLSEISPPPAQPGDVQFAEGKLLAAMVMPERPVVIGQHQAQGDVPAVRLVQATDYFPAAPATGQARVERASSYRDLLLRYRQRLLQSEMNAELQKN